MEVTAMGEAGVLGDFMSVGAKTKAEPEQAPSPPASGPPHPGSGVDKHLVALASTDVSLDEVYRCLSGNLRSG
jgi:hypothetical protein